MMGRLSAGNVMSCFIFLQVSEGDTGNNFFVDPGSIGNPRAEVVKKNLLEMNPDVEGFHVEKSPTVLILEEKELAFFDSFNLVIACNLADEPLLALGDYLFTKGIPLLSLKAYGLCGIVRFQAGEHIVTESHYKNDRYDLFVSPEQLKYFSGMPPVLSPLVLCLVLSCFVFPELQELVNDLDPSKVTDTKEHSHIPYAALLPHLGEIWKSKHGEFPKDHKEKTEFKKMILR